MQQPSNNKSHLFIAPPDAAIPHSASSISPSVGSSSAFSKHRQKTLIDVIVAIALAVAVAIILMFCRCWKSKKARRQHENPPSALPKDVETHSWQYNNPAPPSSPKNSSELCSCPSTEIHTSSTITGGVGDLNFICPGFPPPPTQFDTAATASFSQTTFLTSVGIIEDKSSHARRLLDGTTGKPLPSHPLLEFPSALETNRNGITINQLKVPNSHSTTSLTGSLMPSPLLVLNIGDGDSGTYHTASAHELAPPSPDTTSTFVTSPEPNNEVLPDKGHMNNIAKKTKPLRSHTLAALPYSFIGEIEGEGSSRARPNRVRSDNQMCPPSLPSGMALNVLRVTLFSYEELARATDQFSIANLLGQGGFGFVHKGILANGDQVAIKQLKLDSGQGDREFQAEVEIISRVHHKHLVSLVGYCMTDRQRILVYEFVPNNSLKFHLHGNGRPTMEWSTRVKIALGSAKGLAYLHEDCHPKIIHRDIKSDNILLDLNCEAKIADFGLAKIFPDDKTHIKVTQIMGTFGYLDPGCFYSGKFTEKSDVYSFGVMILELITGRQAITRTQSSSVYSLVEWARPLMEKRNYSMLVDCRLQGNYDTYEMERVVACAAACVRPSSRNRPRMSQIMRALEGHLPLSDLNEGVAVSRASTMGTVGSISHASTLESFGADIQNPTVMISGEQKKYPNGDTLTMHRSSSPRS